MDVEMTVWEQRGSEEQQPLAAPVARLSRAGVAFPRPDGPGLRTVFRDVSVELNEGEILVMVGRSGCGKTTALNLFAGLVEPTSGVVEVFDEPVKLGNDHVGYMFARDALLPWRSVLGNVELGLEHQGVDRERRREIARHYVDMVHLSAYEEAYPLTLSQGMRQRVALARTWALSPRLLLMDEPFAALDAQTRASVQNEFLRMWSRDRRSVVFVTHDLNEAIFLADRILVFAQGRVAREFTVPFERPRDIVVLAAHPEFQEMYRELRGLLTE